MHDPIKSSPMPIIVDGVGNSYVVAVSCHFPLQSGLYYVDWLRQDARRNIDGIRVICDKCVSDVTYFHREEIDCGMISQWLWKHKFLEKIKLFGLMAILSVAYYFQLISRSAVI